MISIPIFVLGGQLGLGLTLQDLIFATFGGAAILGVIGSLTARLGAFTHCSTALIARITFGRKGASTIAFLLAMIAIVFHCPDIMVHFVPSGFSWIIFVMMMFATWAANDCNLYSSSLSLAAILPQLQRSHLAIIAGVIGIALAEFHVAGHMVSFLTLLGILIAPISGVFVINAIGRKAAVTEEELANVGDWHWGKLLAWA